MGEVMDMTRRTGVGDGSATDAALFVRTSGMEIVEWDRGKIAEALVRETYLDPDTADKVAAEVEKVILNSSIEVLTECRARRTVSEMSPSRSR